MEIYYAGQLEGEFNGFDENKIFEFTNGQKWRQKVYKYRYVYKYRPRAKILIDNGRYFIQIDGMTDMAQVEKLY